MMEHTDLSSPKNNANERPTTELEDDEDLAFETSDETSSKALKAELASVLEMPDDMLEKPELLKDIGDRFSSLFDYTRDEYDISDSILAYELAVNHLPIGDHKRPGFLHHYGLATCERYILTGSIMDIDQVISRLKEDVSLIDESHVALSSLLDLLGDLHQERFDHIGDLDDISKAISFHQKGVQLTPEEKLELPDRLNSLGTCLRKRFAREGNLVDISEAISLQQKCLQLTPEDHDNTPAFLYDLATSLHARFERTGHHADFSEALSLQHRCIENAYAGHPNLPIWLNTLGVSLLVQFESTRNLMDISEAITVQRQSIQLTPEGHIHLPVRLNNLGNYLQRCFEYTGNLDDISEAISLRQKCIHLTPDEHENQPRWMNNLGISLQTRFEHTGDLANISEAISLQRRSIQLTPEDDPDLPQWLNNLGISLHSLFEHTGDLSNISEAISVQQESIRLAGEGHSHLPRWLNNLGVSLETRFERTGNLIDISEAISLQRRCIYLTPEDHAELPERLDSLCTSLHTIFIRTERLEDISEAISLEQRCIKLTPAEHTELPRRMSNLGALYYRRFEHTHSLSDIIEAISFQRESIRRMDDSHADFPSQLNNLGVSLQIYFGHTANLDNISEAILLQRRCIERTPQGHANLPRWLYNLGISFQKRFERMGDLSDISEAIKLQRESIQLIPDRHADLPGLLTNLGNLLHTRFERTAGAVDAQNAMLNFQLAATSLTGPPSARLLAAEHWVHLCKKMDTTKLMEAYRTAIHLISQVAGLEQTIETRYTNLINISHLSSSAAAAAIDLGQHSLALEWLEQGRCLVWNQLNNLRTPVGDLRGHDPALADDIVRVSTALEKAGSRTKSSAFTEEPSMLAHISLQDETYAHIKLAQEWDQLLTQVRQIPRFEDFLRPVSYSSLIQGIPDSGHIIVVNIHEDRSDALVLHFGVEKPLHLPLPDFPYEKADFLRRSLRNRLLQYNIRNRADDFNDSSRGSRRHMNEGGIADILRQLWLFLVKPILENLRYIKPTPRPPRIWWCATGPLAFLPIHAAGIYTAADASLGEYNILSDYAVSSYIPTVRTLIERMKIPREENKARIGILTISQPHTPKMAPLPATTKEVEMIQRLFLSCEVEKLCLQSSDATVNRVQDEMDAFSCIHLACHASQNTTIPLQSCFYLYDGRPELAEIIKKHIKGADLAFLSACQTSSGDEALSEEVVHLAAGMLAAGYRGVVGTMWSIKDSYGPELAEAFYRNLLTRKPDSDIGPVRLSSKGAAHALHYATQEMRKKLDNSERSLLTWIPFVHFGF